MSAWSCTPQATSSRPFDEHASGARADVLVLTDPIMALHDPGAGHPERPARLSAAREALEAAQGITWRQPKPATREQLALVHDAAHIDSVESFRGRTASLDPDTSVSERSVEAACLAVGAGIDAVDAVMTGEDGHAFVLARPPGHHAEPQTAMGFCLFNNIAVAAAHAISAHGLERVLVLDWDVHHGNGTQRAFETRRDVLFCSLHQYPFYPGTGASDEIGVGAGEGYTVNVALPPGCEDADYVAAFDDVVLPIADVFEPQLVLVSAGFDAHRRDPLAGMQLGEDAFASMAAMTSDLAARHAGGRVVLFLEGGYDLDALKGSVRACVDALSGATRPDTKLAPRRAAEALRLVKARHRERYRL